MTPAAAAATAWSAVILEQSISWESADTVLCGPTAGSQHGYSVICDDFRTLKTFPEQLLTLPEKASVWAVIGQIPCHTTQCWAVIGQERSVWGEFLTQDQLRVSPCQGLFVVTIIVTTWQHCSGHSSSLGLLTIEDEAKLRQQQDLWLVSSCL